MNHKPTLWSMKPKYGGVLPLCKKLGYGSDTKDARNWFKLKTRLIEHRKEFAASSMARGTQFPLYYDHVEAQRCATLFLKNNGELFSQEEEGFIGPTLFPNVHDGRVRDDLARLMCVQEWIMLNNPHGALQGEAGEPQQNDIEDPNNAVEEAAEPSRGSDNYSEWEVPDSPSEPVESANLDMQETHAPLSTPVTREMKKCFDKHLRNVYPLKPTRYRGKTGLEGIEELEKSKQCPKHLKPELLRYLHNNSLYNISRPEDIAAIAKLAQHLINFLGIESSALNEHLYERCKKLVRNSSKKLERDGCLVKREGLLQRNEAFQAAWDRRNVARLAYDKHVNIPGDGAGTEVAFDLAHTGERGQKRPRDDSGSDMCNDPKSTSNRNWGSKSSTTIPSTDSPSKTNTGNYKRQKSSPAFRAEGFKYPTMIIDLTDETCESQSWSEYVSPYTNAASSTITTNIFRAPVANMSPGTIDCENIIAPVAGAAPSNTQNFSHEQSESTVLSREEPEDRVHTWSYDGLPASLPQHDFHSQHDNPAVTALPLDMHDNQEPSPITTSLPFEASLPYGVTLASGSFESPVYSSSQEQPHTHSPTNSPTQPDTQPDTQPNVQPDTQPGTQPTAQRAFQPAGLQGTTQPVTQPTAQQSSPLTQNPQAESIVRQFVFVLYKPTGAPDFAHRIPFEEFKHWDNTEFFSNISTRQPEVYQSAEQVTLCCEWTRSLIPPRSPIEYTIDRNMATHDWTLKRRIIETHFHNAKIHLPDERTFQIYVSAPNMGYNVW